MAEDEYKLLKKSRTLTGSVALYKGTDHLLIVEQIFYMMNFKRIFFADIQGAAAAKTYHFEFIIGIQLLAIVILLLAITSNTLNVILVFIFLLLVFLVIHVIGGPTCKLAISTDVQDKALRGIFRRKQWLQLKKVLIPLIEEEQGRVAPEKNVGPVENSPDTNFQPSSQDISQ